MFVVYFGENMPLFIEKTHFENSKWFDELFLNENCRLYICFTEFYFFYWLLVVSLVILIAVPIYSVRSLSQILQTCVNKIAA